MNKLKFLKQLYYFLIALDAGLGLLLLYYWLLRQVTTFGIFWESTKGEPVYLFSYVVLTFLSAVVFGLNAAILAYAWPGSKALAKDKSATFFGGVLGAVGSACPTCGAFLLSLLGAGGLISLLPFKGLEVKAVSLAFLVLGFILATRKIENNCEDCAVSPENGAACLSGRQACLSGRQVCPSEGAAEKNPVPPGEKHFKIPLAFLIAFLFISWQALAFELRLGGPKADLSAVSEAAKYELYGEIAAKVLPQEGFKTKIRFGGEIIPKLAAAGAIDLEKFKELYGTRGGLAREQLDILTKGSDEFITINAANANFIVNIFWALGIANKNEILEKSPMANGSWSVFDFASTGGWTLGKEENGGAYYNKFELLKLTKEQQEIAEYVAKGSYRPCCNNSTYFPDCNHGAALLALIELGASQGLSKEELFDAGKKFNSFWFPGQYVQTALYFRILKGVDWENADAEEVMSEKYSSAGGWYQNVGGYLKQIPGLIPEKKSAGGCGA